MSKKLRQPEVVELGRIDSVQGSRNLSHYDGGVYPTHIYRLDPPR